MSCGVGHRHGRHRSDLALLWLWCRSVATALIRSLAWEPPYATGSGPRKGKKTPPKKKRRRRRNYTLEREVVNQGRTICREIIKRRLKEKFC